MRKKLVVLYHPKVLHENVGYRPPLSLLAVAGPLLKKGYNVKIIDEAVEKDKAKEKLLTIINDGTICLGISIMVGYQLQKAIEIAKEVKSKHPTLPIIFGGWHPSISPIQTIENKYVDIVVKGQGEETFLELVEQLERNKPLKNIAGIIYKVNGKIINNPIRSIYDINKSPPIPYHLLDIERYVNSDVNLTDPNIRTITYISSQGCPHNCSFCADNAIYKRRRVELSAERVLDDMDFLIKKYNINRFVFEDNDFFTNENKVKKICEGIIKNNWKIEWTAKTRVDEFLRLDNKLLDLIKRSGCSFLLIGAESGDQKILDLIRKKMSVEDLIKFTKIVKTMDIPVAFSFMFAFPEESPDTLDKTLSLIREIKQINQENTILISYYTPYPGTDLYETALKYGLKKIESLDDWAYINPLLETKTPWINDEYKNKVSNFIFYLLWAYPDKNQRKKMQYSKFGFAYKLMHKIALHRINNNSFMLPLEYKFNNLIKNMLSR